MKRKLYLLIPLVVIMVSGCATGRIMVTGTKRDAIKPEVVRVYSSLPSGADEVALVMVESDGKGQGSLDRAIEKAKQKAASVGANGIVPHKGSMSTIYIDYVPVNKTHFTFRAIRTE